MSVQMECMCLECGISAFYDLGALAMDDYSEGNFKAVKDTTVCTECGGRLVVIGKAGDEPNYRLE
jgi:DNA-directed RNA polymerase subunit RPC12/RpoP